MVSTKSKNRLYSQTYRDKDPSGYRSYQRDYKSQRYEDPKIRAQILKNAKLKYYYNSDPLPSIRKLWNS